MKRTPIKRSTKPIQRSPLIRKERLEFRLDNLAVTTEGLEAQLSSLTEERDALLNEVRALQAAQRDLTDRWGEAEEREAQVRAERDELLEAAQECYGLLDMLYDRYGHDDWAEGHQDMVNEVLTSRRITERLNNG